MFDSHDVSQLFVYHTKDELLETPKRQPLMDSLNVKILY